ncbi:MAG: hypothetical protein ACRDRP_00005 [Pseudonocardiaceae bacterium]
MPSTRLFTTDDLDDIGCSFSVQPFEVAAELVDAVDRGRVADPADTGYALMLAAELTHRAGDLQATQVLAVEAHRAHGDPDGYSQAFHAELPLRLGREDEGMAELASLRPLLSDDSGAVSYISEALERGGHAEIAEQWLTEALHTELRRRQALDSRRGEPAYEEATEVVSRLVRERHRVRRDLGLPRDEHDYLAEVLQDEVRDVLGIGEPDYEGTALLFWPRPEFDRLLLRWPVLAGEYGQTWDGYLATVQRSLVLWSESGHSRLVLLAGAVDHLAYYAEHEGSDPTDPQVRQGYAQHLAEHSRETAWPSP